MVTIYLSLNELKQNQVGGQEENTGSRTDLSPLET